MQRFADLFAQLAEERNRHAGITAQLVLDREWDRAGVAARKYEALQLRLDGMLIGTDLTDRRESDKDVS